jgi:hypothetical protein
MKDRWEMMVNVPRRRFIELFDNPENMPKWSPGLESFAHVSGTPGQPGAKSRLVYPMGKKPVEMIETVTSRNLPDEFSGTHEASRVRVRVPRPLTFDRAAAMMVDGRQQCLGVASLQDADVVPLPTEMSAARSIGLLPAWTP